MKKDLKTRLVNREIKKPSRFLMSLTMLLLGIMNKFYNVKFNYDYDPKTIDGKPAMDGGAVSTAQENYSQNGSAAEVNLMMNANGASQWAQLTGQNIGKPIAIVLDGYVYSDRKSVV